MIRRAQSDLLSVDQVTRRIKGILELDPELSNLAVEGEISEFKRHSSGHVYFTLTGQESLLPGVMFRGDAQSVIQWPRVGDRVAVVGRIGVYPQRMAVQIYARKIMALGAGAAARAKEELRRRLEAQGIFAPERKRPLPAYPGRVACLTSPTGAAVQDVCSVWRHRFPAAELVVVPCLVQGLQAVPSMIEALQRAALIPDLDAVMLVRGGGGRDDLNPFDDPDLVLEIARSRVPLVTGVGHQSDWTLCDLAADLRAPTPSAAAELVFPHRGEVLARLDQSHRQLRAWARRIWQNAAQGLAHLASSLDRHCQALLADRRKALAALEEGLVRCCRVALTHQALRLQAAERALHSLSPPTLADRGYIHCLSGGALVLSAQALAPDDEVTLQFLDGSVDCRVESPRNSQVS